MLKWFKSKLGSRKAQFFIISTVIVAASLATVSSHLTGYSDTKISEAHALKEMRIFRNIKEEIGKIKSSSPCGYGGQPRKRNLQEFKLLTEKKVMKKGSSLNITYGDICDGDGSLNTTVILKTSDIVIEDEFEVS